jgi:hypothetical protein
MDTLRLSRSKVALQKIFSLLTKGLFTLLLMPAVSYAAPYPATGSSLLVAPELGLFWKRQGFELKTGYTGWQIDAPHSAEEDEQLRYIRPNVPTASLAVRTEMIKTDLTLENYTKRWIRDYTNYGFDLLGTQTFYQSGNKALVVDLVHKKSSQQLRQVLFLKNKRVVVLTCRDQQKTFEQTLIGCNQISKSFQWTDTSRPTTF